MLTCTHARVHERQLPHTNAHTHTYIRKDYDDDDNGCASSSPDDDDDDFDGEFFDDRKQRKDEWRR